MKQYSIQFVNSDKPALELVEGAVLSEHLTALNSPILFGCRAGICGTCVCEIIPLTGSLPEPSIDEQDALTLYAPENKHARLACQVQLLTDISIRKIEPYE